MGMKPRKLPVATPPRELPTVANYAPGGPHSLGDPEPVPERTPENLICLNGPCRYFWSMETMGHSGNPASYWRELGVAPPRQRHLSCLRDPSGETDFTDDNVYTCNQWDPMTREETVALLERRNSVPPLRHRDFAQEISEPDDIGSGPAQAEFIKEIAAAAESSWNGEPPETTWEEDVEEDIMASIAKDSPEEEETDIP